MIVAALWVVVTVVGLAVVARLRRESVRAVHAVRGDPILTRVGQAEVRRHTTLLIVLALHAATGVGALVTGVLHVPPWLLTACLIVAELILVGSSISERAGGRTTD